MGLFSPYANGEMMILMKMMSEKKLSFFCTSARLVKTGQAERGQRGDRWKVPQNECDEDERVVARAT